MTEVLPRFTKPQRWVKDEYQTTKETVKVGKAQIRYYITQGEVISLTHMFQCLRDMIIPGWFTTEPQVASMMLGELHTST